MTTPSPGLQLGPYELISPLGAGGMGEVWKARDTRVDRVVAIKFSGGRFSERFDREARAIAALNHPHICHLYDVGPDYLVMEFVDGAPLRAAEGPRKLLDLAVQIAGGMAAAHSAGIVHRDLKPDNILVTRDGQVKILDFGLARQTGASSTNEKTCTMAITDPGTVVGTIAYMSPEQARGQDLDARSDQFAFGVILYELAAGKRPFQRASAPETMTAIIREDAGPLPITIPAPLRWTIERCLAKDPAGRYDSTRDLFHELRTLRDHLSETVSAAVAAAEIPPVKAAPRRWPIAAAAALLVLAAGVAAGVFWQRSRISAERSWTGVRLGGPRISLSPRISPDGHLLAFIALIDGDTQVGIMKPAADSWTMLTRPSEAGYIQNVSWSPDGSKLYFDRVWSKPAGVYTIPPLGGDPALLLENAWEPQALPDGSLLVLRITAEGEDRLFHYWPQNGKLDPLPAWLDHRDVFDPLRAFPDGREVAFFGRTAAASGERSGLYILDLQSGKVRKLDPRAEIDDRNLLSLPIAVTPGGVVTIANRGDTYDLIEIARDGSAGHRTWLTFRSTEIPWYVDVSPDGSVYLDQVDRPSSILRFSLDGGKQEELPSLPIVTQEILPLPDGRVLAGTIRGRLQVRIGDPGSEMRAFLQTAEETSAPLVLAGPDTAGLLIGSRDHRRIALASISKNRILREFPLPAGDLHGLAFSPDQTTIYYAQGGAVYSLTGSGTPKRIGEGYTLTMEPGGRNLYAKQLGRDPIRLVRIDTVTGKEEEVTLPASPRLTYLDLSPNAVDAKGRMLVDTAYSSSWFYRGGMLDLKTHTLTPIPLSFPGDVLAPGWTPDGKIVAAGVRLNGSLWRYRPAM